MLLDLAVWDVFKQSSQPALKDSVYFSEKVTPELCLGCTTASFYHCLILPPALIEETLNMDVVRISELIECSLLLLLITTTVR